MDKKTEVINSIYEKISQVNYEYKNLISNDLIQKAINLINNSENNDIVIENIKKSIVDEIEKIKDEHVKQQELIKSVENYNPEELDTKLKTYNQGIYLSSLVATSLALVNCSSIEEINKWIDAVPNLYMVEPLQNVNYTDEQIESLKIKLFKKYQDSMICTDVVNYINSENKEDSMRYSLHKKLIGLNLSLEEELKLGDIGLKNDLPSLYRELEKICIDKYGQGKGTIISQKIPYYFTSDYENFNSSTYEQMVALNEQIKSNVLNCKSVGGDFQLVIRSISYGNTVHSKLDNDGNELYEYNFDISTIGQELAEKLDASYRLRSMINRNTAEEMAEKLKHGIDNKDLVIKILKDSLASSLQSFNDNIKDDKRLRTFELFNELVEIHKDNRDYKYVWEETFGITLEDLIQKVIIPNASLINELKSKNVDFMYNETLLQESPEKRTKVMETMLRLQELAPGLITVFGDQDHTFSSDYKEDNIEQLRQTAEFVHNMTKIVIGRDKFGNEIKLRTECSERDLSFSKEDLISFKQKGMSDDEIKKYKQVLSNKHGKIFESVPYTRECEWTTLDNISGDYFSKGMQQISQKSYAGKYHKISNLGNVDNTQRIQKDMYDFNSWKTSVKQLQEQKKDMSKSSQLTPVKGPEFKSFKWNSPSEKQKVELKIQKNQIQAMNNPRYQNQQQLTNQKQKVKTLNNNPSNKGFTNVITLSLITSFVAGAIFMLVYLLIK